MNAACLWREEFIFASGGFPEWEFFEMNKYSTDPRTEVKRGAVELQIVATRGCPFQCTFCASRMKRSQGNKYRMRDPKAVVDEMAYMHEKFGSNVFSFMDLAFPLVVEHASELCEEIIRRKLDKKIRWFTECRVKPLSEKLLTIMKKAGLLFLTSADRGLTVGVSPGESTPLIPDSDNNDKLKFYISTGPGEKQPVEFFINSSGNVDLYIERYHLQKRNSSSN